MKTLETPINGSILTKSQKKAFRVEYVERGQPARLPALMAEFRAAVESLGLVY